MAAENSEVSVATEQPRTDSVDDNAKENGLEISPKKLKLDENGSSVKKRRSSSVKQKPDEIVVAEAMAFCGDFDLTEGRQLRRRSETPKAEKRKPATPRKSTPKEPSGKDPEKVEKSSEMRSTADEPLVTNNVDDVANGSEEQSSAKDSEIAKVTDHDQEDDAKADPKADVLESQRNNVLPIRDAEPAAE